MNSKIIKKLKIPNGPGVYFFLKDKKILYIGKATSLKDRVKSYFGKDLIETRGPLLVDLIFKANRIKWQETDNVLEALILEASLIKRYQPKYNTKEKSDKSFNYVCITKEKLPKVILKRGRIIQNQYEKFSSLRPSRNTEWDPREAKIYHTDFVSIFGPFTNSSQLKEAMKIIRPIFPFLDNKSEKNYKFYKQINLVPDISSKEGIVLYKNNLKNLRLFFEGKKKDVVRNLKKDMMLYAKNREFEKAGIVKRQLFALQHINDVALIKERSFVDKEIFGPAPFFGRIKGNKAGPSDTKISLSTTLSRIEAYDIAHMGGKNMVGVMVVLENGELNKNEYRKFSARGGSAFGGKTILGNSSANDTGALKEVLERRLAHKEWAYPDLIVVDGGVAQLNIVNKIMARFSLAILVVAVVKDERHKARELKGDLDILKKYKREILLVNSEAHRFAITYHKNMRNKNFLK